MSAPEFQEVFMCKLSAPMTCYSAPVEVSPTNWSAYLATEKHVVGVQLRNAEHYPERSGTNLVGKELKRGENEGGDQEEIIIDEHGVSFEENPIPIISGMSRKEYKKSICVGYTHRQGWEAILLLDASKSQDSNDRNGSERNNNHDGERTTASTSRQPRRTTSGSSAASASSGDGTASTSATSVSSAQAASGITSDQRGTLGGGNQLEHLEEERDEDEEAHHSPVARLILQHRETRLQHIKPLDFRPLSPCITIFSRSTTVSETDGDSRNADEENDVVCVWLGSADDSKLRLYQINQSCILMEVSLDAQSQNKTQSSPFSFSSPVMAIDYIKTFRTSSSESVKVDIEQSEVEQQGSDVFQNSEDMKSDNFKETNIPSELCQIENSGEVKQQNSGILQNSKDMKSDKVEEINAPFECCQIKSDDNSIAAGTSSSSEENNEGNRRVKEEKFRRNEAVDVLADHYINTDTDVVKPREGNRGEDQKIEEKLLSLNERIVVPADESQSEIKVHGQAGLWQTETREDNSAMAADPDELAVNQEIQPAALVDELQTDKVQMKEAQSNSTSNTQAEQRTVSESHHNTANQSTGRSPSDYQAHRKQKTDTHSNETEDRSHLMETDSPANFQRGGHQPENDGEGDKYQIQQQETSARNGDDDKSEADQAKPKELEECHQLAVACQDGTIRFLWLYWSPALEIQCQEKYTVIVDGPIICLHLNYDQSRGLIEAVFGSLCGYAARFLQKTVGKDFDWQGPFMVAEGFWNLQQTQEDSVLAVHAWDNKVAIGTYSGRCLLYGPTSCNLSNDYGQPFWDCCLPEPINGLCHIPTKSSVLLLVSTRRSIHVFQEMSKTYCPDMAKRKLEFLLSKTSHKVPAISPAPASAPNSTARDNTEERIIEEPATGSPEVAEAMESRENYAQDIHAGEAN